ncbi:hypothetical protein GCM10011609_21800 [Lentzea pudingi]|uniref:Uncharacterized protein n=1 Tax=Lentzea pudingi TaxID=1789439 RepID=A0ABQ2HN33_9PSEU|nr:hypothetical protein [Lentzea pudingi]GGM85213.1 hypothetical protein GCM10011609_21800 [Lentzea pudingi]
MTAAAENEGDPVDDGPPEENERPAGTVKVGALNVFNDIVHAPNGTFGSMESGGRSRRLGPDMGKLDPQEVRRELEHYVAPLCQANAESALSKDHVVAISGLRGSGKRAAALSMLRARTDGPLVALSPVITPQELATRTYEPRHGYIVIDQVDTAKEADTDFAWTAVREAVREAGAFLVITRTASVADVSGAVKNVFWERVSVETVLRAHLDNDADVVNELMTVLPDDCPMDDLADVTARVRSGEPVQEALRHLDIAAAQSAREWFEQTRTRKEILEIATLAFGTGVTEREFESRLAALEAQLEVLLPLPEQEPVEGGTEPVLDQSRARRLGKDSLMKTEKLIREQTAIRVLTFKDSGCRVCVLAELNKRMPTPFWDAVKVWIHDIVEGGADFEVASGLALLAKTDAVEVEESYLDPWSRGELGEEGRDTAAIVLWLMCFDEDTAPVALRIVRGWTIFSSRSQRLTAAIALSGELAARFPYEAVRMSWKLLERSPDSDVEAYVQAFAMLFATLVHEPRHGAIVLGLLVRVLDDFEVRPPPLHKRELVTRAILAVLTVRGGPRYQLAIHHFIRNRPDRLDLVARVWAAVLLSRPHRRDAVRALLRSLDLLRPDEARSLGEALADAVPVEELVPLRESLDVVRHRNKRSDQDALIDVLLETLQNRRKTEGPTS